MDMTPVDRQAYVALPEHCYYCFQSIISELEHRETPEFAPFPEIKEKLYVAYSDV